MKTVLNAYKRILTAVGFGGASFAPGRGDRIPTKAHRKSQVKLFNIHVNIPKK